MKKLNNPFRVLTFLIEVSDWEKLHEKAHKEKKSKGEILREAVKKYFKNY